MVMHRFVGIGSIGIGLLVAVGCGGGDEAVGSGAKAGEDDGANGDPSDAGATPTSTSPTASGPAPTATGLPSSMDLGMTPASLGMECETDADCGDGVTCLTEDEDFTPGIIAGGFCTIRCEQDPEFACGSAGLCGTATQGTDDTADDIGYCYDFCLYTGLEAKCDDELNRVCLPINERGAGVCENKCFSDGECPGDTKCNPRPPWTCVDESEIADAAPDGAVCTEAEDCSGGTCFFLEQGAATGICMSECTMRPETAACHRDLDDSTPATSICMPPLVLFVQDVDVGWNDIGNCLATCEPEVGCDHEDWSCLEITNQDFLDDVGVSGVCLPSILVADDADAGAPAPVDMPAEPSGAGGTTASGAGGTSSSSGAGGMTNAAGAGGMADAPDAG